MRPDPAQTGNGKGHGMKRTAFVALALPLALAGCNSAQKSPDAAASPASGASAPVSNADSGFRMRPGQWEIRTKMSKFDMPGMPADASREMAGVMAREHVASTCVEDKDSDKPGGAFFGQPGKDCAYDHATAGGGKFDAQMTCNSGEGKSVVAIVGTCTGDSCNFDLKVTNAGGLTMAMTMASRRTGDCTKS